MLLGITDKIIPKKVYKLFRKVFKTWKGDNFYCPVCENNLKYFDPIPDMYFKKWKQYGFNYGSYQEMLNFENYYCPVCRASDRDRIIKMYLIFLFENIDKTKSILF